MPQICSKVGYLSTSQRVSAGSLETRSNFTIFVSDGSSFTCFYFFFFFIIIVFISLIYNSYYNILLFISLFYYLVTLYAT